MANLRDILLTEDKKPQVLADAQALLDDEVRKKRGVSGFAVKAGYKVVKTLRRGFLRQAIADLIPEFCDALDPLHSQYLDGNGDEQTFGKYMVRRQDAVTDALLGVTDGKAERSTNKRVKSTYLKLRPRAEANVREAVPGLARLMDKHYA